MSDSNGPVRRRRIAGEAPASAPAKKAPVKKSPAKKAPAKKVPAKKAPATAKAAPAKKTPIKKAPAAKKASAVEQAVSLDTSTTSAPTRPSVPTARRSTPAVAKPVRPAPAAAADDDGAGTGRPGRADLRWLVPAALVTAAVLVLGALLAIRGVQDFTDDGGDLATAQRQATSAAATASEAIFSYRYDQLDGYVQERQALMTPAFGKKFAEAQPLLEEIAPQVKVQMKGVTQDAAPIACGEECSDTKVDVLLFFDQVRLVGDANETTTFPRRLKMTMVKADDGWLVDDIVYLENSPESPGETTQGDTKAN
ncbi:hypothetical protein [Aeromicrobium stalagmiti]|uniref:hypothetical protein n=1 Tax=Aeromicrobium stalagmiti TaxID=2738988 RepID=UPI001567EABD|nr:hypothetical protein [Aeromicrobium stalagmiti]NRQ49677.1 hypothetical protein [Aeromicrobium stalagmiti]